MHIDIVPNRNSKPAVLLRESYREGKRVRKRTLANLSKLPMEQIAALRRVLKGETLVPIEEVFEIVEGGSRHHGHVDAVLRAMKQLGFERLVASRRSRERDLVVAMVAARVVEPDSKLATTRWWHSTTLAQTLGVDDADEDDLYAAMDWVLEQQGRIERKLATRHLKDDALALYDLTSSYFEGVHCPLAARGHNRDGKKGKLQVNYGLLANRRGIPVAVSVFDGNVGDPKTLLPQVEKVRQDFGIKRFAVVGDRGMITQKQIDALRELEGIDWITALRPGGVHKLVEEGVVQIGLFDERNLFELTHPDFPGERLVACRNPEMARRRADKRKSLLEASREELLKVQRMIGRGRLRGRDAIGEAVRKILAGYKIGEHVNVEIHDDGLDFEVDEAQIAARVARESGGNAESARKRQQRYSGHLARIIERLAQVRRRIERGQLYGKDAIGVRVGKVINKYKVAKHFKLEIDDDRFEFHIDEDNVVAEAAVDGIYIVRTSLLQELNAEETVRGYKQLSQVERAFRSFKTIDLKVRPIRHRLEKRVRAHIFLCMLAYYVQWHMLEAWRPLLFCDEQQQAKATRDPVAPAERSEEALRKVHSKRLEDGSVVHSFRSLLHNLSSIVRNICRRRGAEAVTPTFDLDTPPDATQRKAYNLLTTITA